MESNYMHYYIPIVISLIAVAVSIITFIKKEKSDQFRIALDIHDKLEKYVNEVFKITDKGELRLNALEYLNLWEYFSFLVNNREITNKNLIKFFEPSFRVETQRIFQLYPDIVKDDESFGEIKKLLTKLQ